MLNKKNKKRKFRYHPDHPFFILEINDKKKGICSGMDAKGKVFVHETVKWSRTKKRKATDLFVEWFDKKIYGK